MRVSNSFYANILVGIASTAVSVTASEYPIVDATTDATCWEYYDGTSNTALQVDCGGTGQDGDYANLSPNYCGNEDGTVTDMNTGLMWTQDSWNMTYDVAVAMIPHSFAGYDDWR
jgi:hypothetical protein